MTIKNHAQVIPVPLNHENWTLTIKGEMGGKVCKVTAIMSDASIAIDLDPLVGEGVAYWDTVDEFDASLGMQIALGRALKDIACGILRDAKGTVKHRDDMREQGKKQKSRRVPKRYARKSAA